MTIGEAQPELPAVTQRAGDERSVLIEMLDYYRLVLLRQCWGLDQAQLAQTLGPSELSLGGLLKHMALVENNWFSAGFRGLPPGEPWGSADWDLDPDWDFHSAADDPATHLIELYEREVAASQVIIAEAYDLDELSLRPGTPTRLRWILVHMIEEYARHCGHADLIRQSIDGRTDD